MRSLLVLAVFVAVACAIQVPLRPLHSDAEYQFTFTNWMLEHGKSYSSDEFRARFDIFKSNMDYVTKWNAQNSTTVLGLNIMADLSNSEYQNIYLGTRIDGSAALKAAEGLLGSTAHAPLADVIDWRTKGAVTPIKDQGQCGSCWAFSTTGSVEGAYFLAKGQLVSLSEQNLVDCSSSYGNQGCNGGLMDNAFKYIIANKGIDTEASYPYTARNGQCHFTAANVGATITGYKDVQAGSEAALLAGVNVAPVSVAIDASKNSFQLYKSGIYYEPKCSSSSLDHGVLAVGYGTDASGNDYWIVKNSWGTSWGTAGYIQMTRNKSNNCGIATAASYPSA